MMAQRVNLTDRAKRYRAQKNVTGPRKCVLCGSTRNLDVMHLSGNEADGEPANLAYGCRSCNGKLAAGFKRIGAGKPTNQYNPSTGVPTFQQYAWAVANHSRGAHDEGGVVIHATPKHKRIEYARRIAETKRSRAGEAEDRWNPTRQNIWPFGSTKASRQTTPASGGIAHHQKRKVPDDLNAEFLKRESGGKSVGRHKGYSISKTADGEFFSSLDPGSWFSTKAQAQKHIDGYLKGRGNPGRVRTVYEVLFKQGRVWRASDVGAFPSFKEAELYAKQAGRVWKIKRVAPKANPASASAEAFEEFHGYAPNEVVKVTRQVHHHTHLAAAGELVGLKVKPINGSATRDIEGLGNCLLAFNERKNQLFIEAGDQRMSKAELKKFGVAEDHELHTLGKLIAVGYDTDKKHLGDEGGKAIYSHTFRTTNENGKHITVRIARYPDLIYRVLDEQFEISGGSYEILREGIDK